MFAHHSCALGVDSAVAKIKENFAGALHSNESFAQDGFSEVSSGDYVTANRRICKINVIRYIAKVDEA